MMNAMPMMNSMMPQMMNGMMNMTCEMSGDAMVCKMMPMGSMTAEMMQKCCDQMNAMMKMGMPMMMMCGGMMMMCMMPEANKK